MPLTPLVNPGAWPSAEFYNGMWYFRHIQNAIGDAMRTSTVLPVLMPNRSMNCGIAQDRPTIDCEQGEEGETKSRSPIRFYAAEYSGCNGNWFDENYRKGCELWYCLRGIFEVVTARARVETSKGHELSTIRASARIEAVPAADPIG